MEDKIKIARVLFPVKNLGPGNRVGIWVYGCKRGCEGCANPELWELPKGCDIGPDKIRETLFSIQENGELPSIDGITISGGEPFLQPEGLGILIDVCREYTRDILLYTGFERNELGKFENDIIKNVAVLIDGAYIESLNNGHPLKGSDNQVIHYIDEGFKEKYESYILKKAGHHEAQLFSVSDGNIATGIHKQKFSFDVKEQMKAKGLLPKSERGESNGK